MSRAVHGPAWCADAWVMHQIFRKLGFTPDEIYFDCNDAIGADASGSPAIVRNCVIVSVKQRELEFVFTVAPAKMSREEAYQSWTAFAANMNTASDAEHKAIWDSSRLQQALPRAELVMRLLAKGFVLKDGDAELSVL